MPKRRNSTENETICSTSNLDGEVNERNNTLYANNEHREIDASSTVVSMCKRPCRRQENLSNDETEKLNISDNSLESNNTKKIGNDVTDENVLIRNENGNGDVFTSPQNISNGKRLRPSSSSNCECGNRAADHERTTSCESGVEAVSDSDEVSSEVFTDNKQPTGSSTSSIPKL